MLVMVVAPFVIEVVSRGIVIFRVLSADHCSCRRVNHAIIRLPIDLKSYRKVRTVEFH